MYTEVTSYIDHPVLGPVVQVGLQVQSTHAKLMTIPFRICSVFRWLLSLFSEKVGLFLANETTPEYLKVPYSRVVVIPGGVPESVTYVETDMVSGYTANSYVPPGLNVALRCIPSAWIHS